MVLQVQGHLRTSAVGGRVRRRASIRRRTTPPAKVCIVEDDDDIREALEDLLTSVGYETTGYDRADEALNELETLKPDLILLDLMMPGMNGWQFRVEQKRRPALRDIPVIVLSADVSPYAAAIDADAYIPKPLDFDHLQTVMEQVLLTHERRRLADKAMELERIRSLGMLTASVAHEINNPLAYVIGCLELAEKQARGLVESGRDLAERVERLSANIAAAAEGADRVSAIVKLLSTFSRADDALSGPADPVRAVEAALRLALHQIKQRARLVTALEPVPSVNGNEARLAQVVLNLLVNAAHAIPLGEDQEHEIRVATRVEDDRVVIEVSDDGEGIEPEMLEKIFQPFFTTKPPGTGTGLGLSISRDIVKAMGGSIEANSSPGRGSTFRVLLPLPTPDKSPPE